MADCHQDITCSLEAPSHHRVFASNTATYGVAQSSMWRCHTSGWQPLVVGIIHQESLRPEKEPLYMMDVRSAETFARFTRSDATRPIILLPAYCITPLSQLFSKKL